MKNKIEFGNSVGYKIIEYATKKKILDFLFSNIEEFNYRCSTLNTENDLLKIKNDYYFVSPNISGDEYLFISKKINNIYYNVVILKNSLSNLQNINYNNIVIISLKVRLSAKTFNGTILDGKIVNLGGCCVFLINDCFMLYGNNIIDNDVLQRHEKVNSFLDESYIIDNNMNVIDFRLNKLNEISDIKDLVYNRMKNSSYDFDSIIFIPKRKNKKFIFYLKEIKYNLVEKILLGKKIDVDVIELFTKDSENELRRIGIAHIPTIKCSHICDKYISDELVSIKCRLNLNFKKWEPIEINLNNDIKLNEYEDIKNIMMNIVSIEKQ